MPCWTPAINTYTYHAHAHTHTHTYHTHTHISYVIPRINICGKGSIHATYWRQGVHPSPKSPCKQRQQKMRFDLGFCQQPHGLARTFLLLLFIQSHQLGVISAVGSTTQNHQGCIQLIKVPCHYIYKINTTIALNCISTPPNQT